VTIELVTEIQLAAEMLVVDSKEKPVKFVGQLTWP
jgi:hypothetical protein